MDRARVNLLTGKLIAGTITEEELAELRDAYEEVAINTASEDDDDLWS